MAFVPTDQYYSLPTTKSVTERFIHSEKWKTGPFLILVQSRGHTASPTYTRSFATADLRQVIPPI